MSGEVEKTIRRVAPALAGFAVMVVATVLPAWGRAADCMARCADGADAVAVVNAGPCGDGEECWSGCDAAGSDGPRPHAACISVETGEVAARAEVFPLDARRERR